MILGVIFGAVVETTAAACRRDLGGGGRHSKPAERRRCLRPAAAATHSLSTVRRHSAVDKQVYNPGRLSVYAISHNYSTSSIENTFINSDALSFSVQSRYVYPCDLVFQVPMSSPANSRWRRGLYSVDRPVMSPVCILIKPACHGLSAQNDASAPLVIIHSVRTLGNDIQ